MTCHNDFTFKNRIGEIAFDGPQGRGGSFYPGAQNKGLCNERSLTMTLAGRDVPGVSPLKDQSPYGKVLWGLNSSAIRGARG